MTASLPRILHLPWSAWPETTSIVGPRDDLCTPARSGGAKLRILGVRFGDGLPREVGRSCRAAASFASATAVETIEASRVWDTLLAFLDRGNRAGGIK